MTYEASGKLILWENVQNLYICRTQPDIMFQSAFFPLFTINVLLFTCPLLFLMHYSDGEILKNRVTFHYRNLSVKNVVLD